MSLQRFTVTGPFPVADVQPGEVVELDPELVNLGALLESGHIAPVAAKRAKKAGDPE